MIFKRLWNWHLDFIRRYPIFSAYIAWGEGLVIGILLAIFFL